MEGHGLTEQAAEPRRIPVATVLLILLSLAVFVYQYVLSPAQRELFVLRWAVIPLEITESDLEPRTPISVALTAVTSLFLHIDWLHLASNLFYLWVFGEGVERALGRVGHLSLYVVCGAGGALLHVAINPTTLIPLVGASGAIAGVMAAHLVLFPRITVQLALFAAWLVLQALASEGALTLRQQETGGVALWTHIAGLALGAVLALALRRRRRPATS